MNWTLQFSRNQISVLSRLEDGSAEGKKSSKEKCCTVIAVLLFIIVVTMTVLFATTSGAKDGKLSVCSSRNCVVAAAKLAMKMNPKIDPCQDFAEYACGGFYKDTIIPDDKNEVGTFSLLNDENQKILRLILSESMQPDDLGYVKKMKSYYSTCMDEDKIEEVGLDPYMSSEFAKKWPTTNPLNPTATNLNDLIAEYKKVFTGFLFSYGIATDLDDSNKHKLTIYQTGLGLSLKYMKLPRNDSAIMAYQQYYVDVAVALGAKEATAQEDAEAMVDFERILANISVTPEESIDLSTVNNPTTFEGMAQNYSYIDWHRLVQTGFDVVNMTIPMDFPINNKHPKYFDKLGDVLKDVNMRLIQNKLGFRYALSHVGSLTKKMREIKAKYRKAIYGQKTESPRWKECISSTGGTFGYAVSKKFIAERFPEESKTYMLTLVANLKKSFGGMLKEADWMADTTKQAAYLKLNNMRVKIGYPDKKFSDDDIEKKYENYTVTEGNYYETIQQIAHQSTMEYLRKLPKPVDKDKWGMTPYVVNAYFSPTGNEIVFPAGILQSPFFSAENPSSMNYGAIGVVIGHEITHGFDQSGSQFDYEGNVNNWWQPQELEEYKNRTQCLIDQFSGYRVESIGMNVNGKLTAGENAADNGGLKESYRAYKTYAASQPEELPLPGLGLTTDQQFFLAYAQVSCQNIKDAALKNAILVDPHSPERVRIKGPLHNNKDFARVFKCPSGSPMNPVKKCSVW